ncbi:MAG: histidine kinase [Chloroflexota bacterium]
MFPLQIHFSGYAIIGLTLVILSASVAVYLMRLPGKSQAMKCMIAFFTLVAFSGLAIMLNNTTTSWAQLFEPWQDFWILAGGVALALFAYSVPRFERSLESTIALAWMGGLALITLGFCVYFNYRFLFHWTPELDVPDTFYLLLPIATLSVVIILLRRSVILSARAAPPLSDNRIADLGLRLIHPQGDDAGPLRNLALALSLAFLPGIQTLVHFPYPASFIMSNIGSLLAIVAMALVYFNYAPEVSSFMAKLVGITLATVLLIFSVFGALDVNTAERALGDERINAIIVAYDELIQTGTVISDPASITYVVSWDALDPENAAAYRELYRSVDEQYFDLQSLVRENQSGYLDRVIPAISLIQLTENDWWGAVREQPTITSRGLEQYSGYFFNNEGTTYEIGFSHLAVAERLSETVSKWLLLVVVSSSVVLLAFPLFFRKTLVQPIDTLVEGIKAVNRGDLETSVPITFGDEIGSLTNSFNELTQSLKTAREQQDVLFQQLQDSHEELEERVADRTRELSAFTDLTMLPGDRKDLASLLRPILNRIVEVELCDALCVHLLSDDQQSLVLVAQRNLSEPALRDLEAIPMYPALARRIQQSDVSALLGRQIGLVDLPPALRNSQYDKYLGSPLLAGDQPHGWLSCYRQGEDPFSRSEVSLLVALARQMGVIVENQQLRQRIMEVAAYEERGRLARDLHDSVTQLVYSMTLFTRASQEALEDRDAPRLELNLARIADTSLQALQEMRFLLFELQPPALETQGLAGALNARFDMVERRVGIRVNSRIEEPTAASRNVERELYFVAIEALNNTLKHANADTISLSVFRENGCLQLSIVDNGRGFDLSQAPAGMGIENMHHRIHSLGGELEIDSTVEGGTSVIATVPVEQ